MRRLNIIFLTMAIILLTCLTVHAQDYDFRKTHWGMNIEEVKTSENKEVTFEAHSQYIEDIGEEADLIVYEDRISGIDCDLYYAFIQDKLILAGYVFVPKHTDKNGYIDDYRKLKELLTKKYKKPENDEMIWGNDLFRDNKQKWGEAISKGHLKYQTQWLTTDTIIILELTEGPYRDIAGRHKADLKLSAIYDDEKAFTRWYRKKNIEKALEKL